MNKANETKRQAQNAINKAAEAIRAANEALNEANEALRILSMGELDQVSGGVGLDESGASGSRGTEGSEWGDVPPVNEKPYPTNP